MTTGYQIKDQEGLHFLTFQIVDWIDIFTRKVYKDIIIDSFKYSIENKGFQIFAYVIMSNHIHLVAQSSIGRLSDNIRDLKKFTSKRIISTILEVNESRKEWLLNRFRFRASQHSRNEVYQVWTHENHAMLLYSNEFIREKIEYIHDNPVRAGIVRNPEDYLYSSARNYASLEAPIDIPVLVLPWFTYR
ncbi:MAG: transposase [Bacteroidia bacterium]|nr:transposase [Bacteroidia bacterium]